MSSRYDNRRRDRSRDRDDRGGRYHDREREPLPPPRRRTSRSRSPRRDRDRRPPAGERSLYMLLVYVLRPWSQTEGTIRGNGTTGTGETVVGETKGIETGIGGTGREELDRMSGKTTRTGSRLREVNGSLRSRGSLPLSSLSHLTKVLQVILVCTRPWYLTLRMPWIAIEG